VLHPVGPLRPAVYWWRRLAVLVVLVAVAGAAWYATMLLSGRTALPWTTAQADAPAPAPEPPALSRVVPSLAPAAALSVPLAAATTTPATPGVTVAGPPAAR
jgi:hypothetical protein